MDLKYILAISVPNRLSSFSSDELENGHEKGYSDWMTFYFLPNITRQEELCESLLCKWIHQVKLECGVHEFKEQLCLPGC